MDDGRRAIAREMARHYLAEGDGLGWFEALYARADGDASIIPWADLKPNASLVTWLDREGPEPHGRTALKVGCGLGDDAEELAARGYKTTAFDISPTAVSWCRRRHPVSPVTYVLADLFHAPPAWQGRFDLVLESYTLQVLPVVLRVEAMKRIASFVARPGTLLIIARGREPDEPEGTMPWPLTKAELTFFRSLGLREIRFEDYMDSENPPARRFRVIYRRE